MTERNINTYLSKVIEILYDEYINSLIEESINDVIKFEGYKSILDILSKVKYEIEDNIDKFFKKIFNELENFNEEVKNLGNDEDVDKEKLAKELEGLLLEYYEDINSYLYQINNNLKNELVDEIINKYKEFFYKESLYKKEEIETYIKTNFPKLKYENFTSIKVKKSGFLFFKWIDQSVDETFDNAKENVNKTKGSVEESLNIWLEEIRNLVLNVYKDYIEELIQNNPYVAVYKYLLH